MRAWLLLERMLLWPVSLAALARSSEPGGAGAFVVDFHLLPADHVGEKKGFDFGERAVARPFGRGVASAVELVGGVVPFAADGLFAVVEEQVDGVAGRRVGAKVFADGDE